MGVSSTKDENDARKIAIALIALVIVLVGCVVLAIPTIVGFNQAYLAPGVGLKDAAIISLTITVVVLVGFAAVAGDGLIGELQFMLLGFFGFFLVLWPLIAWVF